MNAASEERSMMWYEALLEPVLSIEGADRRFLCALESVKKAVDGLARTLAVTATTSDRAEIHAQGDGLRRIQTFTRTLVRFTPTMAPDSATVAAPRGNGARADLARLVQTRTGIRALRRACAALEPLIRLQFLKPRARAATASERPGAPSIIARDALAIIDVEAQLVTVIRQLDDIQKRLERTIRLAIDQQDSRILWTRTSSSGCSGRLTPERV